MTFEKFRATSSRGHKPKASVRRNGQIGFNRGAIRRFGLDTQSYAVLYFDRDTTMVGIELHASEPEEGGIKLQVKDITAWLSAKTFLDYFDIPYGKTRKFDVKDDPDSGMLIFGPVKTLLEE